MPATLLDGKAVARQLRTALGSEVAAFVDRFGCAPTLAVVQVLGDPAGERYMQMISNQCRKVGIAFRLEQLPATVRQADLEALVSRLSADPEIHGLLLELPLPEHLNSEQVVQQIDPRKDVDGVHPVNIGLLATETLGGLQPNTPTGAMVLLEHYGIDPADKHVAVVGRSAVVGLPLALLLLNAHATVTVCHLRTPDLRPILRTCEIVAVAAGHPGLVTGDMLRPGAVVLDFGINVLADGSIVGDVDFASAIEVASAITPVPGGTGPMTNVLLLRNVLLAATRQLVMQTSL